MGVKFFFLITTSKNVRKSSINMLKKNKPLKKCQQMSLLYQDESRTSTLDSDDNLLCAVIRYANHHEKA